MLAVVPRKKCRKSLKLKYLNEDVEGSHAVWDERKVNSNQEMLSSRRNKKEEEDNKKRAPPDIVSYMISFPLLRQLTSLITCQKHFFHLVPVHIPSIRRYIISHSARSAQRKHRDCASRCRQSPGSLCSRGSHAGECCRSCLRRVSAAA